MRPTRNNDGTLTHWEAEAIMDKAERRYFSDSYWHKAEQRHRKTRTIQRRQQRAAKAVAQGR